MKNEEKMAIITLLEQIKEKHARILNPDERTALLVAMECVQNQGKPEWIPIGEAMPENSCLDKVLVHVEGAGAIVTNYFDGFNRTPGCKQYEFTDVEAWMYVPEYEGRGNEE